MYNGAEIHDRILPDELGDATTAFLSCKISDQGRAFLVSKLRKQRLGVTGNLLNTGHLLKASQGMTSCLEIALPGLNYYQLGGWVKNSIKGIRPQEVDLRRVPIEAVAVWPLRDCCDVANISETVRLGGYCDEFTGHETLGLEPVDPES